MRIDKADTVCGLTASDARDVMRLFGSPKPQHMLQQWTTDVEALARALEAEGLFEIRLVSGDGETWWETTVRGNALAQASFRKPISRQTAERHLKAVLERVEEYNTDPTHIYEIVRMIVFGSYLEPRASQLGDLDLSIITRVRAESDPALGDLSERALAYAEASGRQFGSFFDRLNWAEKELVQFLRHRVAAISISRGEVETLTDRWQVVYSLDG
jgi:predicted nucleotidyltransferase